MAIVSKAQAARLVGVSRSTLYRQVKTGKLSVTGEGIDTEELIRVFGSIRLTDTPAEGHRDTSAVPLLQQELAMLRGLVSEYRERERDHQVQVNRLLGLLEDSHRLTHQKSRAAWWQFWR